jgi:orotate phosphoribosyltransferase
MNNHKPNYYRTVSHLQEFIDPTKAVKTVEQCAKLLETLEFTTFAFRGLSGALIAPMLAVKMGKTLLAVRKVHPTGHGSNRVEGDYAAGNYIIVDDFIATGKTCQAIMEEIDNHVPSAKCIAVLQAYYILRPELAEYNMYPETLCTRFVDKWNVGRTHKRAEKAERDKADREQQQRLREEQLAILMPKQPVASLKKVWEEYYTGEWQSRMYTGRQP